MKVCLHGYQFKCLLFPESDDTMCCLMALLEDGYAVFPRCVWCSQLTRD